MFHKSCRMCKHVAYSGGDLGLSKEYYCDAVNPNMPLYGYPVLPFACPENKDEPPKPTRYTKFRADTATIDGLVDWTYEKGSCKMCANSSGMRCSLPLGTINVDICKAGIKAYWEGETE